MNHHVPRYIKAGDDLIPAGVFISQKDAVKLTLKQLLELKKIPVSAGEKHVNLWMTFNQGK